MSKNPANIKVDADTLEPDLPPSTRPANPETFKPLVLEDCEFQPNNIPITPVDLFKAFLPP